MIYLGSCFENMVSLMAWKAKWSSGPGGVAGPCHSYISVYPDEEVPSECQRPADFLLPSLSYSHWLSVGSFQQTSDLTTFPSYISDDQYNYDSVLMEQLSRVL